MAGYLERSLRAQLQKAGNGEPVPAFAIHTPGFLLRLPLEGTVAIGDAYMAGKWDAPDLPALLSYAFRHDLPQRFSSVLTRALRASWKLANPQSVRRSVRVAREHYDLGERLYSLMLGPSLAYSCAYWNGAASLDEAEYAKFDLVFRKLRLTPGMRLLDIGCGFGTFAKYCAERGVKVVGITLSESQMKVAREECAGLPVTIQKMDYRDLPKVFDAHWFDRVVSIGMFEHVGPQNFRTFMEVAARMLKADGLFLLHAIGKPQSGGFDPWINKWIFPGGYIPSRAETERAFATPTLLFHEVDFHAFGGEHYARTLAAWRENFLKAWRHLALEYGPRWNGTFYRGWLFYLASCEAAFRYGGLDVYQFLLSPREVADTKAYVVR